MDYAILKPLVQEVLQDHPGWTPEQIAAHLNDPTKATLRSYEMWTVRGIAQRYGLLFATTLWTKLKALAAQGSNDAELILDWIKPTGGGIDFGDPNSVVVIDNLVEASILTGDEGAKLKELGSRPASLAELNGLEPVGDGHVRSVLEELQHG